MRFTAYIIILYSWWTCERQWTNGKPIPGEIENGGSADIDINSKVLDFLTERGYLKVNKHFGQMVGLDAITKGIQQLQNFVGIAETGRLNRETLDWMNKGRCGRPDIEDEEENKRRRRRFVKQGTSWRKRHLTWQLEISNNDGITDYDVRRVFRNSLEKWKDVTNIDFTELVNEPDDSADIRVRFGTLKHEGCPYPFDNKGSTLAHAFYPLGNTGLSGDVHYDDHEDFSIQDDAPRGKIKLLWVTVHELGHSLGLAHSKKRGAIMYPYYQHVSGGDFNLTDDDVLGIQSLYGVRVTPAPPTMPIPVTRTPSPGVKCTDVFNAAYLDDKRTFHVFNNDKHYILDNRIGGVKYGPAPVETHFPQLKFVDTVFRRHNDRYLVVFHGDKFSIYNGKTRYESPRKITDGFQNLQREIDSIDAAIIWPENSKLYIFKGEDYWGMSRLSNSDYIADYGYPKRITAAWRGLPPAIDSAFKWENEKIYFTKGDVYYRWDGRRRGVQSGYPQKLATSFLKCTTS